MRTFTIYTQDGVAGAEPSYAIKATYPEPTRRQRYGTLQVCTGWTRERVLEQFRRIDRHDVVARLAQELATGFALTIEMGRPELMRWNQA